jgi:ubiquinone/menaquinone biosynthesis C-methylase UbiE
MKKLKNLSGGKILDVGTGSGELLPCLMEGFKDYSEIIGIDCNESKIKDLKKRFNDKKLNFYIMDANKMSFEDNTFDTVCISNTLHHLKDEDITIVLKEMNRVLKPGGLFIICEMYRDNQNEKQMSHVLLHHLSAEIGRINGDIHNNTYKRDEIIEIVKNKGLNVIDTWDYAEEDEKEPIPVEEIEGIINSFEKKIQELKEHNEYYSLNEKLSALKKRLYEVGIEGATELVILAGKNLVS